MTTARGQIVDTDLTRKGLPLGTSSTDGSGLVNAWNIWRRSLVLTVLRLRFFRTTRIKSCEAGPISWQLGVIGRSPPVGCGPHPSEMMLGSRWLLLSRSYKANHS